MTRTVPSKEWKCSLCELPVNPASKMIDKKVEDIRLTGATKNEFIIQSKINEIIELLRSNGSLI